MTTKEHRRNESDARRAARKAAEKRAADKLGCQVPGCKCENAPRDNPDCEAHDAPPFVVLGIDYACEDEITFDEVEVEPAAPKCLDCGGPEGGGKCTRCSFREPTRPHMLAGFGGGPNDIPSCQVCGEVAPLSFSECPGAPAPELDADDDETKPGNGARRSKNQ
jgi:hypothetical protein